jgi:hypothetical protein
MLVIRWRHRQNASIAGNRRDAMKSGSIRIVCAPFRLPVARATLRR